MVNSDVIDLYGRTKVGARVWFINRLSLLEFLQAPIHIRSAMARFTRAIHLASGVDRGDPREAGHDG